MAKAKATNNHVSALVADPASPPRTKMVAGYLGASPFEGFERLYLEPTLNNYVDIPENDLLHQVRVPNDHLGAVYVWIRAEAALIYPGQVPAAPKNSKGATAGHSGAADEAPY